MAKGNFIIISALMLFIIASTGFAESDKHSWQLVDTKNGCQTYTRVVAGKEYIAAKTTCVFPARMEIFGVIIRDIASYPEWMSDCKETRMLKVADDQNDVFTFWFRQHITLFTDRDMVLKSKVVRNTVTGFDMIYADSTDEMSYNAGKGYIRMPSFHSLFTLEWIDREHTRVTFMIDPDLGKGIPVSIGNMKIKKTPYKTLMNLMKMAKMSKYIEAAKTSKYNRFFAEDIKAGHIKK